MPRVRLSITPGQEPIDAARIQSLLEEKPRRLVLGGPDWPEPVKAPGKDGQDWVLVLPFRETFWNCFAMMCTRPHIGPRTSQGRCYTYFRDTASLERADLRDVDDWVGRVGSFIGLRDALFMSFALDFDREDGDPAREPTEVGELRRRAKPYGGPASEDTLAAAAELESRLAGFFDTMTPYRGVTAVVAMPPSRLDKPFDLPRHLATLLANRLGLDDLSANLRTVANRREIKELPLAEKVGVLEGSLAADGEAFDGRDILLLDDIYQSGASANVAAMKLVNAGARRVFGLFCEKTCRNDSNVD